MSSRCTYLLVILAACDSRGVASAELQPAPPSRASSDPPPGIGPRMTRHFEDSVRIKDAVIAGELDELRAPALRLLEAEGDSPPSWRPFIAANIRRAKELLVAGDLKVAAVSAAGLARTCGDCHAAIKGPEFPARVAPALTSHDPKQRMRRHQWAADRLWEAMIAHSDAAWTVGTAALTDAALLRDDDPPGVEIEGDPIVVEEKLRAFGARAAATRDWDERVVVYGEFLSTCAACHEEGR